MNGGYKIIDLRGENLSEIPVVIPGVYESIEENYRKPLLLADVVIDGRELSGAFATADIDGTNYVFSNVYGGNITITDENAVTYAKNS